MNDVLFYSVSPVVPEWDAAGQPLLHYIHLFGQPVVVIHANTVARLAQVVGEGVQPIELKNITLVEIRDSAITLNPLCWN